MGIRATASKVWIGSGIMFAIIFGAGTAYILKSPPAVIKAPIINNSAVNNSVNNNSAQVPVQFSATAYLIAERGNKFVAVPVQVATKNSEEAIASALKNMIEVRKANLYSAVPEGTKILGLDLNQNNIRLNLSKEFTNGGGSDSMRGRLIQVLYTATSLNPDGNLFLSVEGKPLESLGGEGVEVSQPLRRQNFALEF